MDCDEMERLLEGKGKTERERVRESGGDELGGLGLCLNLFGNFIHRDKTVHFHLVENNIVP